VVQALVGATRSSASSELQVFPISTSVILTSTTSKLETLFPTKPALNMASTPGGSGASTPNPRFKSQTKTVEDVLATQTVGLVALSDFRKRRAEALEQKEKDAHEAASGTVTPKDSDG
jgi:hypothetical protein